MISAILVIERCDVPISVLQPALKPQLGCLTVILGEPDFVPCVVSVKRSMVPVMRGHALKELFHRSFGDGMVNGNAGESSDSEGWNGMRFDRLAVLVDVESLRVLVSKPEGNRLGNILQEHFQVVLVRQIHYRIV